MMQQAIYCSVATRAFPQEELLGLLGTARRKNDLLDITAMLLYDKGAFMQVLEGPKEHVDALLLRLLDDPRHHQVRVLSVKPIAIREFGYWGMAFFREEALGTIADSLLDLSSVEDEFTVDGSIAQQVLHLFQQGLLQDAAGSCTITIRSRVTAAVARQRRYLVELGRTVAHALPDVPEVIAGESGDVAFNQKRDLYCGEIELF